MKEYNNAVTLWADDVYRFAIHCSCDEDMGKDAVQEAYTALWEHRDSVNVEKVKSFLLTVVHNWVMSQHRHHKVHEDNAPDLIGEKVVAPEALAEESLKFAKKLTAGPLVSYANIKKQVYAAAFSDYERFLDDVENPTQHECSNTEDFKEGCSAFMEKRKAAFQGK